MSSTAKKIPLLISGAFVCFLLAAGPLFWLVYRSFAMGVAVPAGSKTTIQLEAGTFQDVSTQEGLSDPQWRKFIRVTPADGWTMKPAAGMTRTTGSLKFNQVATLEATQPIEVVVDLSASRHAMRFDPPTPIWMMILPLLGVIPFFGMLFCIIATAVLMVRNLGRGARPKPSIT